MSKEFKINDVILFNPDSFESSRCATSLHNHWIYCDGVKPWRNGTQIPFIKIAGFNHVPHFKYEQDVFSSSDSWVLTELAWSNVPCDTSSCMLVVDRKGVYVKLLPLNDDYKPPVQIDKMWIPISVLSHGIDVGLIRILS